jgi:hypothetical protein
VFDSIVVDDVVFGFHTSVGFNVNDSSFLCALFSSDYITSNTFYITFQFSSIHWLQVIYCDICVLYL